VARNILLFTLLVDDVEGLRSETTWNVYYHPYLDDESYRLLEKQSKKLHALSASIQSWHNRKYGGFLRICDDRSLIRIRKAWNSYCTAHLSEEEKTNYNGRFKSAIQRAVDTKQAHTGRAQVITGLRSAAPAILQSLTDLPRLHRQYWDSGTTYGDRESSYQAPHPNLMFISLATDSSTLHYGTDPLLGFHLATAYTPLIPKSSLIHPTW